MDWFGRESVNTFCQDASHSNDDAYRDAQTEQIWDGFFQDVFLWLIGGGIVAYFFSCIFDALGKLLGG